MSKEEVLSIIEGEFSHFEGKVFDEWSDKFYVDPPSGEHVRDLDVLVGIDPSLTRTGLVWVGFDSDNVALVFDELAVSNWTVEQVCEEIRSKNERWGVEPEAYIIDPSSRNRALTNMEQVEGEFARHGVFCFHGQNAREAGIMQVKRRLQHDLLLVSRECVVLGQEFDRYRKDPRSDGEFDVIKTFDDELDALRYVLMHRAWGVEDLPAPRSRSFDEAWPPNFPKPEAHPTGSFA